MQDHYAKLTQTITRNLDSMRRGQPDVMKGFGMLGKAATAPGVLDEKTKELIALALGVSQHCDGCIGFHAKALVKLGATLDEVRETLSVAVYMGGGPSLMYAANAIAAFEEFSAVQAKAQGTPV